MVERSKTQTLIDIAFNIDIFIQENLTYQYVEYTLNGVKIHISYDKKGNIPSVNCYIAERSIKIIFTDIDIPDIVDRIDKITSSSI